MSINIIMTSKYGGKKVQIGNFVIAEGNCGDDYVHNGGWYNTKGEKVGWGDLSKRQLIEIMDNLEPGDIFFVLGEYDSYWDAKRNGVDEMKPGLDYVVSKARYAISHMKVIELYNKDEHVTRHYENCDDFDAMTRQTFRHEYKHVLK